jgi:hypothetical protein
MEPCHGRHCTDAARTHAAILLQISSSNTAVVADSMVTSFSSGGGVAALFQSEMISALKADQNDARSNAIAMAGYRISVMVFLLCV